MGVQPTSQGHYKDDIDVIYELKKEVEQLQVANNELTAELTRYRAYERQAEEDSSPEQLARNLETAEDHLWHSQDQLALERAYTKGFATVAVVSTPATVALLLWTAGVEGGLLTTFGVIFTVIFGLAALLGIAVTLAKLFGQLPEAKRLVKRNQLVLDRAQMRKLGL